MAWIWVVPAAAATILVWAISLWRVLSSPTPSCLPPRPPFLSPFSAGGGRDKRSRNVLLVVAHPDDESMFFTPTILFLKSKGHNIHILCMSQGNADGLGNIRKEELSQACAVLKDGFHEKWDHGLLAELTMDKVKLWDIDSILTFDSYGVSSHPNHRDVHHGICKLLHEKGQGNIEAWQLVSLNILRKYTGPVDIWLSSLSSFSRSKEPTYTLVNNNPFRSYQAMAAHRSQWVWFRRLFVLFSSYTYINMLQKI